MLQTFSKSLELQSLIFLQLGGFEYLTQTYGVYKICHSNLYTFGSERKYYE